MSNLLFNGKYNLATVSEISYPEDFNTSLFMLSEEFLNFTVSEC